jgi:hypothetical protein
MLMQASRRNVLKNALVVAVGVSSFGRLGTAARAADAKLLDAQDPAAKAFGFVTDASRVDPGAHPSFQAGQRCALCALYQGKATDPAGGCGIFSGRLVPQGGWCMAWARRTG